MSSQKVVAAALLRIKAVGFTPKQPITFKSGIISPVYVDNRRLPFYPKEWQKIITGFESIVSDQHLRFDVIAGIETAGIPHSAALGYALKKPSVFVRKKVKDHGTKSRVEGGDVTGKKVLLIEDHITTGGSSLAGVEALRASGAIVETCLAITDYGFAEATAAFAAANINLITLTTFPIIMELALKQNLFTKKEHRIINQWFVNPHDWGK